jgi:hypothetical protein
MAFATVDDLIDAHGAAKSHRINALMMPTFWTAYSSPNVLAWQQVKFGVPANNLPDDKIGVYCFVIEPNIAQIPRCGLVVYIGRARNSFRTRYENYLKEKDDSAGRPKVVVMLNLWKDHLTYYYAELPTPDECSAEESRLLTAFVPEFNSTLPATVQAKTGAF